MEKKYIKIDFMIGGDIKSAISELNEFKQKKQLARGTFNGVTLYSDVDDINSAYVKITGKTKTQFDIDQNISELRYEEHKKKHKESIPELTKQWIKKGSQILDEKYRDKWNKCVPIRLDDLYEGMELGACLDIVSELNNGCTFETAKEIIEKQGHSGTSYGLVCLMVKSFCDRGNEFVNFINQKETK